MQVACDTEPKRNDDGMAGRQQSPSFTQREQWEPHPSISTSTAPSSSLHQECPTS